MTKPINKRFARLVNRARSQGLIRPPLTWTEIAERCGVTRPYLWMIYYGHRTPSEDVRPGIAKGLGVSRQLLDKCF